MKKKTVFTARSAMKKMPRVLAPLLGLVIAAAGVDAAQWTGTSNWNWLQDSNWQGGVAPNATGATATFNASTVTALLGKTISINSSATVGKLEIIGASAYNPSNTLVIGTTGQTLVFNNSGAASISLTNSLNLTIAANITSTAGALTITNASASLGKINITGALNAGSNAVTFSNSDATAFTTVSGKLTAGSLSKQGAGKLILNGAGNSISGNVTFGDGTIVIGANNVLGSGTINVSAGTDTQVKKLNLADNTDRTLSNALNLSASDLSVGREDSATASVLRTLTLNPSSATTTSIGTGTRKITIDGFTGLTFGPNHALGGTGTLAKYGTGILTLSSSSSTFGALDVRQGTVVGNISGNVTIGGASSILGAGVISVNDGNATVEITSANIDNVATIGTGANITINNGVFRLSNATLSLQGGAITLSGSGLLDYQGTVILGNTTLNNVGSINFGGNVVFTDNTGIASSSTVFKLTNTGTQVLSRQGTGNTATIAQTVEKTGTGTTTIDASLATLTLANGINLLAGDFDLGSSSNLAVTSGSVHVNGGTITFGKDSQYGGAVSFTGTAGAVNINGTTQSLGTATVNASSMGTIDLGGDNSSSTTLTLAGISLGNTSSLLKFRNYADATLALANADKVMVTGGGSLSGADLSQIWFYGYNKGATWTDGELKPGSGLLSSVWDWGAGTLNWHDAANWAGDDEFSIPNTPGATATFNGTGGNLYGKTINIGAGVTIGHIVFNDDAVHVGTRGGNNSYVTFDTGVDGVASTWTGTQRSSVGNILLKNDLIRGGNTSYWYSVGIIKDDYETSGIGRKITLQTSVPMLFDATNAVNSFAGGMDLSNGSAIYMTGGSVSGINTGTWMGTGAVTITTGTATIWGRHGDARQAAYMKKVANQIILSGNLNAGSIYFDYAGDVELTATRTITSNIYTDSTSYKATDSTIFGENFKFTGTGGLIFSGAYYKRLLNSNNDFTGGLSTILGTLWADGTHATDNEVVVGTAEAGKNVLGAGNVSVAPTSTNVANIFVVNASKTTVSGALNLGTTVNGTFGVLEGDTHLTSAANISGSGYLRTDGDLYLEGANVSAVNLMFAGDSATKKVYSTSSTVTVGSITKSGLGTATLDAGTITTLTTGNVTVIGGLLALGANNQISATNLNLNGGTFDANGYTNGGITNLNLLADSSLSLGTNGGLSFTTVGTGTNWSSTAQLVIQNDGSTWADGGTGSYVRFSNDIGAILGGLLGNIAFTGYEAGAKVVSNGSYYYLLPNAGTTNEWSGAGVADQIKWGTADNWLNDSVPGGIDVSVSFRDLDGSIGGKTINVDGNYKVAASTSNLLRPLRWVARAS